MSRKLHEFLNADTGQFRRATKRDATFAEKFEREKLGGAARCRTAGQAGQQQDIFGYFNGHVCHTSINIARRPAFVKPIFRHAESGPGRSPFMICGLFMMFLFASTFIASADNSGVSPQAISLPAGPGSMAGLGEKFQPQLNTGSFTCQIPLKLPPMRGGAPSLSLEYNPGNENGMPGLGWALRMPCIQRQTDQGLPQYISATCSVMKMPRNSCIWPTAPTARKSKAFSSAARQTLPGNPHQAGEVATVFIEGRKSG
jgi:hypothetical protein